ncbi:MAG TPA: hypothetical protein PKJ56_02370, partial [Promineifilum sp.]|nr:hypothetical protein [Promineifilum sp.]
ALPAQEPGQLLVAKGVWQRHFVAMADEPIAVDQQIYRLVLADGVSPGAAAALLNSAWFALGCELGGRVNLGEGVLWLAAYELAELLLPDPRELGDEMNHLLEESFRQLATQPIEDTPAMLERPERRALDNMLFDLLGLSAGDREASRAALVELLDGRRQRAANPQG